MQPLTKLQIAKINKESLANKHKCSSTYVSLVLEGKRLPSTKKAKAILEDGNRIIDILEGNQQKQAV